MRLSRFMSALVVSGAMLCMSIHADAQSLVGYWPLDGNAQDSSAFGNHGVAINGAYERGMRGQAFRVDGQSSYVSIPDSPSLSALGSFTIEAWIKMDVGPAPDSGAIVSKCGPASGASDDEYAVWIGGQSHSPADYVGGVVCQSGLAWEWFPSPTNDEPPLAKDTWYFVSAVLDAGSAIRVYVDGQLVHNQPTSIVADWDTAQPVYIGLLQSPNQPDYWFKGLIDEVRIYKTALSQEDIQRDMAAVPEPSQLCLLAAGGLTLFWPWWKRRAKSAA
jgi:hypothetical protein